MRLEGGLSEQRGHFAFLSAAGSAPPARVGPTRAHTPCCAGPTDRGTTDYASMLPLALQLAFPRATNITVTPRPAAEEPQSKRRAGGRHKVHAPACLPACLPAAARQVRNGCSPGTGSGFANMCYAKMLDEDVDLVVAEFVTNDFIAVRRASLEKARGRNGRSCASSCRPEVHIPRHASRGCLRRPAGPHLEQRARAHAGAARPQGAAHAQQARRAAAAGAVRCGAVGRLRPPRSGARPPPPPTHTSTSSAPSPFNMQASSGRQRGSAQEGHKSACGRGAPPRPALHA